MPGSVKLSAASLNCLCERRYLIADDSQAIRDYLKAMLRQLGIRDVRLAQDGNAALRCLLEEPADILFCDLAMPGMDGVELLRTLAQQSHDLAIVPISSLEPRLRFSVAQMARERGLTVLGTLGKPFQEDELLEALQNYRPCGDELQPPTDEHFDQDEFTEALHARRVHVYYQPQVRISDRRVLGFEALVRMSNRQGQIVSPSEFIGLSESTGQIHRLSHLMIEASLRQLGLWSRLGFDFNLSINFSANILSKLDLPEHLQAIANNRGVPTSRITIELTESQLKTGAELFDVMSRFRMKGFGLSIDDFGTGDSGLTRLRSMPFTELKIDQGFVKGFTRDPDLRSIVSNSIQLGHELGMLVVAEGVQTLAEWKVLQKAGCDIAQGFLISPPLPADKVIPWVQQWHRLHQGD